MLWMAQQQVDHVTAYEWGRLPGALYVLLRLSNIHIHRIHFNGYTSRNTKMAVLHLPWNDSRCTGRRPDICDTRQDTTEEYRR